MHGARCSEEQRCRFVTVGNAEWRPVETCWRGERSDKFDRVLAGILSKGHVLEAVALYLCVSAQELLGHITRLGLPTPSMLPMRRPGGRRPWTGNEIHVLIDMWSQDIHVECIGAETGRSPGGVRSKARRLGLYRRERRNVVRYQANGSAPVIATAASVEEAFAAGSVAAIGTSVSVVADTSVSAAPVAPIESAKDVCNPAVKVDQDVSVHLNTHIPHAQPASANGTKRARQRITWNDDLDLELARRWFAWQCRKGIARDLKLTEAAVRSRATRMGLPPRDRKKIVPDYVVGRPYDRSLEDSRVKRRCEQGKMFFFGTRNGPHTSPKIMQTRRYKELRRGLGEASLHL